MTINKQAISIALIILLFTMNTGCISFNDTSFFMLSNGVIDYYGFPSLILSFKTNDIIVINLINPDEQIVFTDTFYPHQKETVIPLAPYRSNILPGIYQALVYDKNDKLIYNETFGFEEINLSIVSLKGHWWRKNSEDQNYSLIGITLTVINNCDSPIYPYFIDFIIDNISATADIIPAVVLPEEIEFINCSLYIDKIKAGERNCYVSVLDKNGGMLTDLNFQTIPQENVPINLFSWNYNGKMEISIPYPRFLYDYYSTLERLDTDDYAAYVLDPYDDLYLTLVKDSMIAISADLDNISKINLVASFVQNLEYGEDDPLNSSYEYPLYPIELLNKRKCDCEDRAILAGNILQLMGYNVSLLSLPKHMAVGVHINQNVSGYDFYIDKYYYLETIEENMVLGNVPILYRNISEESVVYPLTSRPIINYEWKNVDGILVNGKLDFVKLKFFVTNIGNSIAKNIVITSAFYSSNNTECNLEKINISSLLPGEKEQVTLKINVPKEIYPILKTKIHLNNILIEEKQSYIKFL